MRTLDTILTTLMILAMLALLLVFTALTYDTPRNHARKGCTTITCLIERDQIRLLPNPR